MENYRITAAEAKERLIKGNELYMRSDVHSCDISENVIKAAVKGQKPYAIIVTCSDARVVPEMIFSAGIGDLFVIRIAGNVIDQHQLGSIEYAAEHLGTGLITVLGHTNCGAVQAAVHHDPGGYIKFITDEIVKAVGDEKDDYKACCLNVRHSCDIIEKSLNIMRDEKDFGLQVAAAVYHMETGKVEFI